MFVSYHKKFFWGGKLMDVKKFGKFDNFRAVVRTADPGQKRQ